MTDWLRVIVSGRVQGVGFRYATLGEATRLALSGWVRNLPDGQVEAVFEGPRRQLEQMLDWCRQGPRAARVEKVAHEWGAGAPRFESFRIR